MKNNDQTASTTAKPKRNKYTPQFKEQALERAKQDGVPKAAKDLGIAKLCFIAGKPKAAKPVSHLKRKTATGRNRAA